MMREDFNTTSNDQRISYNIVRLADREKLPHVQAWAWSFDHLRSAASVVGHLLALVLFWFVVGLMPPHARAARSCVRALPTHL